MEPDLMVRPATSTLPATWDEMPTPSLVVEILSATTCRRDNEQKRAFSLRTGVAEYWMVDRSSLTICVVRQHAVDQIADALLLWHLERARRAAP